MRADPRLTTLARFYLHQRRVRGSDPVASLAAGSDALARRSHPPGDNGVDSVNLDWMKCVLLAAVSMLVFVSCQPTTTFQEKTQPAGVASGLPTNTVPAVGLPPTRGEHAPGGRHPLMDYAFTNQFGEPVTLSSFAGQALAITFFFTRCPNPDYCPRLSKNFEEASNRLASMVTAPTNWHFLSVTIDPEFDTPAALRIYAKRYQHDPRYWSFLTGPIDKITELAGQSGVTFEPGKGLLNHNFRTLIIDARGNLQMSFPIGGNISDGIVEEMLKAAAAR